MSSEEFSRRSEYTYRPAWWVPGAHAQTMWGKFFRRRELFGARVERWDTPDGDFVDVHRLDGPEGAPRLFILHGLEGTIRSHYVTGFLGEAKRRGWGADLLIFRGCGDEPNRQPRFYHSGDTGDLEFALDRVLAERPRSPIVLAGVSLGGNVLLKFLGERETISRRECEARRRSRFRSIWRKARVKSRPVSHGSTIATSCARCERKRAQSCWHIPAFSTQADSSALSRSTSSTTP